MITKIEFVSLFHLIKHKSHIILNNFSFNGTPNVYSYFLFILQHTAFNNSKLQKDPWMLTKYTHQADTCNYGINKNTGFCNKINTLKLYLNFSQSV